MAAGEVGVEVAELVEADRRGEGVDAVLEAHAGDRVPVERIGFGDLVAAALVVLAVEERAVVDLRIISEEKPTLTC
nr:hypothetical protein [Glycomyces harbinensis]